MFRGVASYGYIIHIYLLLILNDIEVLQSQ